MRLPDGWPQLSGAFAVATRLPHEKSGAVCARVPSQIVVLFPRFCRIRYDTVFLLMMVASGKRYGMPPKPAVLRFALGFTGSPVMHQFGSPPTMEQPSWW